MTSTGLHNAMTPSAALVVLAFTIISCSSGSSSVVDRSSCIEDPLVDTPGLQKWEAELLQNCRGLDVDGGPVSALGDVRPILFLPSSTGKPLARAHATLGMKALHNFFFDMCKYEFDRALGVDPSLRAAYWGRALCDAQLLWNAENVSSSVSFLIAAPPAPTDSDEDRLNTLYLSAVAALNGGEHPPFSPTAVQATRPARYQSYSDQLQLLSRSWPDDKTARSFVALSKLAVGSVGKCELNTSAQCQTALNEARSLLKQAYDEDRAFPGTLHYGMHAHDFPDIMIIDAGLVYARDYPRYVKSAAHALHMPSHLWDRIGEYRKDLVVVTYVNITAKLFL